MDPAAAVQFDPRLQATEQASIFRDAGPGQKIVDNRFVIGLDVT